MKQFLNWVPKAWMAIYSIWVLIHLMLLLLQEYTFIYKKPFWPFSVSMPTYDPSLRAVRYKVNGLLLNTYDFTEFIFYIIAPILLVLAIYLVNAEKPIERIDSGNDTINVKRNDQINTGIKFCSNCGAKLDGKPNYCPSCGNKVTG